MKTPKAFSNTKPRQGVALIIVLAFVVLLTGVIVAYFSRTMSDRKLSDTSLNQSKADQLARSALDVITGDLKQEILDGSDPSTVGSTTIYTPKTNANMVPMRSGTPSGTPIPNLVRRSVSTDPMVAPGVASRASAVNSATDASLNGRSISPARWNKHYLVPRPTGANPTDTTPISGANGFTAPDWVYVTDQGPVVITAPNSSVIGRYAYAIYDTGGLLDVNVAGYPMNPAGVLPSSSPHPSPDPLNYKKFGYAGKGSVAFADLTAVGMSTSGITDLVGWRNYASTQPSGNFGAFTFTTASAANFFDNVLSNTNGFLSADTTTFTPSGASVPRTDQIVVSRQQLLDLRKSLGFSADSLQYLTHFSRAVNAPSWRPTATTGSPAGNTIDYAGQADTPSSVNRNLPNVRFSGGSTITHYDDSGNTSTYPVTAGEPLIQHRFSLAKLDWLTSSGPKAGISAQAIEACFGLQWDSGKWRWDYVAAKAPPGVAIKTLAQVSAENREPNFFELLNAGILKGSLGRDPGKGIENSSIPIGAGVYASNFDSYKAEPNLQILQIGANIIDQYDTDSYPTAIHFNAFGLTGADDLSIQTAYGDENLPGLFGLCPIAIADPVPPGGGVKGTIKFWLQPSIWNPHQVPTNTPSDYPSAFRAYAYGSACGMWVITASTNASWNKLNRLAPTTFYDDGTGSAQTPAGAGEIYFTDPGNANSPFYLKPCPLTLGLANVSFSGTPSSNCYDPKWSSLPGDISPANQFVGFSLNPDPDYNPDAVTKDVISKYVLPNPVLTISLQYKGPDNNFHPYNFMARIAQPRVNANGRPGKYLKASPEANPPTALRASIDGETQTGGWGPTRPDPRTDRFSEATQWWGQTPFDKSMNFGRVNYIDAQGDSSSAPRGLGIPYTAGFSYFPAYDPTGSVPTASKFYISLWSNNDPAYSVTTGSPVSTGKAYYADPDGVVRYGDGYRSNTGSAGSGDGCQLFHGDATVTPPSSVTNVRTGSAQARRPVILNRPFRSVAEIGFAYRDQPFKTLDLWSSTSADSALLDLFSVSDQPALAAGQINPNSATIPVLQAVLSGASKNNSDPNITIYSSSSNLQVSAADAATLAGKIAAELSGANGTSMSRADLATRLEAPVKAAFDTTVSATANWANKSHGEAPVRALADVSNFRTWNLMIDVIAQTGVFPPGATDLKNFMVQGERRYWLHVAIDRFTGKVVDQQLEPVYE